MMLWTTWPCLGRFWWLSFVSNSHQFSRWYRRHESPVAITTELGSDLGQLGNLAGKRSFYLLILWPT